jgi:8-oxo-dGTP pyrophosphatase MutT (NUDIX family)
LPDHAGQVSFPGGKIDKDDKDPCASALREAREEIGLDRSYVEPFGYLDLYMTTLGYRIVPVIARVKPGFTLKLNVAEVDNTFEVPLTFLMDQTNMQRHSREWQGMTRHYYAITFGEHYIWGVTAGILRNLHDSSPGRSCAWQRLPSLHWPWCSAALSISHIFPARHPVQPTCRRIWKTANSCRGPRSDAIGDGPY